MASSAKTPRIVASEDAPQTIPTIRLAERRSQRAPGGVSDSARVETRPCFTSSWIEWIDTELQNPLVKYSVSGVEVAVASPTGSSNGVYIIDPPEYRLNPIHLQALSEAIDEIVDSVPDDFEIESLATVRPYIRTKAKDILYSKLAAKANDDKSAKDLDRETDHLADLLCKHTAGYGVLETLLEDSNVQDIYVDSPSSQTPVQVVLRSNVARGVRQKCRTNVFVGTRDLQGFVSRIKFETGLPFSEAHPVLEADIRRLGARVTLVGPPLSDRGTAIAIRKHTEGVWPMSTLVANGCLSPLLASLLWACVIGRRTVLIAGSRGAGKTTLLGSMMLEFPLSQRIILIEDTPEIPYRRMQELGYDIQALRFSDSPDRSSSSAENSLRVSLRMGESAIVIGEVRGEEAKVLYESMRAGSAGSAVLGTIHGNSAKGVLDRAVEDLGISDRAFSSTDIIVVIGLIRSPDGARFHRRVVEVAEVRDASTKVQLVPLFTTMPGCSCAKPTEHFGPECKTVAGIANALGFAPSEIMDIIKARAHADQTFVEAVVEKREHTGLGSDGFRVVSNELLAKHLLCENGPEAGLREWKRWFDENG
jgi:flagellar protein FlaI